MVSSNSHVSYYGLGLRLLLALQVAQTTMAQLCEGDVLRAISSGCLSADDCRATAEAMGLAIGDDQYGFAGNWEPKGCVYYPGSSQAYFGTDGTCDQLNTAPTDGAVRLDCASGTAMPPPTVVNFDASACEGASLCGSIEDCRSAAQAMGLQLGSAAYGFEGNYGVKGCHYFPASDATYGNQAYWGTGAAACGDLSTTPSDGSLRLGCGGDDLGEEAAPGPSGTPANATSVTTAVPAPVVPSDNSTSVITTVLPTATPTAMPTNLTTGTPTVLPTVAPTNLTIADPTTTMPTAGATDVATTIVAPPTAMPTMVPTNVETTVNVTATTTTEFDDTEDEVAPPALEPTEAPTEAPKDDKDQQDDNKDDKEADDKDGGDGMDQVDDFDDVAADNETEVVFGNATTEVGRSDPAVSAFEDGVVFSGATTNHYTGHCLVLVASALAFFL